jgi:hypothetical protein
VGRGLERAFAALLSVFAAVSAAQAAPEIYEYRVVHSIYGEIGRYSNTVERRGDETEVRSELRISVRILGISAYRQDVIARSAGMASNSSLSMV